MNKESLKRISNTIINAGSSEEERKGAAELAAFFSALRQPFKRANGKENTELFTASGIAIAPADAAKCTTDYIRTARFIKGIHAALNELLSRFPNQQIRVLYAGCGPYAALVLPVLPFFSTQALELVFLDIHTCSLESARSLVIQLGCEAYAIDFVETDATTYVKEAGFHLIITETMFEALTREPQVAITEHLRSQLLPNGVFIPEEIQLSVACTFFSKEPQMSDLTDVPDSSKQEFFPELQRLQLGILFTIGSDTDFHQLTSGTHAQIESRFYKIPEEVTNNPDVCIYTKLRIFGTIYLHPSESLITHTHVVASLINMSGHAYFKLIYSYRPIPCWSYKLKK